MQSEKWICDKSLTLWSELSRGTLTVALHSIAEIRKGVIGCADALWPRSMEWMTPLSTPFQRYYASSKIQDNVKPLVDELFEVKVQEADRFKTVNSRLLRVNSAQFRYMFA